MNIFRAALTAVLTMTSWAAFAQVRVITPDSEHIYSSDPRAAGQLLDDEALQRENERKERARIERQREREIARRQEELDAEAAQAAATAYEGQQEVGSSYIGTFGIRHRRHVILRRASTMSAVSGNSSHHTHTHARGPR